MRLRGAVGFAQATLATAFLLGAPALAQAAADAPADGLYTPAQAARGRALYAKRCALCHGDRLEGNPGPPLRGDGFDLSWSHPGLTVDDLFFLVRTSMPPRLARTLPAQEHADIVAFILSENDYPAGAEALRPDSPRLATTRMRSAIVDPASLEPPPDFIAADADASTPSGGPTQAELDAAATSGRDWLYHTRDYAGTRYSPLDQIDRTNAATLQAVCVYQLGDAMTFQTGPIVYDGTMYVTTDLATVALDAATCRSKWRHVWEPKAQEVWSRSRGVAIKDGRLVRGTPDGYLLSLDAATGDLLWARRAADSSLGETFTMPPLVVDDLVLIGPAGSENNVSGWVGAYRLADGEPVWRFNTVPAPGEPGAETWPDPKQIPMGGGAVWTPFSLDRARGEVYVAATNPAPDLPAGLRPGKNLYTNAIVALDVRTGKLRWYEQFIANDDHDWDVTQVSPLWRGRAGGAERDLVATAGKDGIVRTLDRSTRETLYSTPVTTLENVEAPVTAAGTHACPGLLGGVEWNGPALHPELGLLYVPAVDWCATFTSVDEFRFIPGKLYMGGTIEMDETRQGWITALDAATGAVRWRYRSALPMVAAVTPTAGGVLFTGELGGDFLVLDAESGKELYRWNTGGPMGGGVVTYEVAGRQYVAAASGKPSPGWGLQELGAPTIVVFALPASVAPATALTARAP
jgi:alcohol dehydrogenase (cytochrome c)